MAEISRRAVLAVLGAGALAAGGQYTVDAATTTQGDSTVGQGPDNPVRAENRQPGSKDWKIGAGSTVAADDLGRQIKGYTSATSVNRGETIDFHVSTDPPRQFIVSVFRMGDYGGLGARHMTDSPTLPGVKQAEPTTIHGTGTVSCQWDANWSLKVPQEWVSGSYLAAFTTDDGHRSFVPFVVRDDSRRADFLVVLPFTTYQAYNQWPLDGATGKSFYYGYGHDGQTGDVAEASASLTDPNGYPISFGTRARKVSFERPFNGVGLPQRSDMDYAFLQWAERSGYDVAYATSVDLHEGRVNPAQYSAMVFSGHDEYWSQTMRDIVETAVDRGTHVAFMGANNVYWHVRFEPDPRGRGQQLMVCYKSDPDPEPDASGPTKLWRTTAAHNAKAEQSLIGVQYNGIPKQEMPLIVSSADHWLWAGTGVREGDAIPRVVGGEADGWDPGSPKPVSVNHTLLSASHFMALGGPNWPRVQHTSLYETAGGAVVFAAATFNWTLALNHPGYVDARIQRASANLFNRLRQRPAGSSAPA